MALDNAGLKIKDIKAVKGHKCFTTNDINFTRKLRRYVMKMNNFGHRWFTDIAGHRPQAGLSHRCLRRWRIWVRVVSLDQMCCRR